ncbi:MAG: dipeptidase PepE [Planctomycetes bacterium]|nr:dipeptidase PepE [Planctomycetota bacterium]
MKRLLLISNSTLHGSGYLDHCAEELRRFLGPEVERVAFVPYALHDRAAYAAKVRARLERMGLAVTSLHEVADPRAAVLAAQAVFVGGGNTFRLLDVLHRERLIEPLRARVLAGMPYVGSSAGSNVACVTIQTTNDMPIVAPPTFAALDLVPFNLNPHYLDPDPSSRHMGETREQRITEFHEVCARPVLGLREGAMLRVEGERATLLGTTGARLFRRGRAPEEFVPPARLDDLLVPVD